MYLFHFYLSLPITAHIKNADTSAATIVEPTGVPKMTAIIIPASAHITEITAEKTTTGKKLLNIRIAESAGKITSAEINSEPTRFIASTMITAVITAVSKLQAPAFIPAARKNPHQT